jgi:hypothetical protein
MIPIYHTYGTYCIVPDTTAMLKAKHITPPERLIAASQRIAIGG